MEPSQRQSGSAVVPPRPRERLTVRRCMRREFVSISPDDSLRAVHGVMSFAGLRHVPVVSNDRLVGTVSHRRLRDAVIAELEALSGVEGRAGAAQSAPIAALVQPEPEAIGADSTLEEAARRMIRLRVGYLPVIERSAGGQRVIGILTEADLLRLAIRRGAFAG